MILSWFGIKFLMHIDTHTATSLLSFTQFFFFQQLVVLSSKMDLSQQDLIDSAAEAQIDMQSIFTLVHAYFSLPLPSKCIYIMATRKLTIIL